MTLAVHIRFAALLVTGGAVLSAAGAVARPLDDVQATKILKVIAYEDNKPFSWSEDGKFKGIDIDVAKAIAEGLGVDPSIQLRMHGEDNGQDIRVNIMRGTIGGGDVADLILHVPTDKEFAAKFKDVEIANAYFQETVALAIDKKRIPQDATFDVFKTEKVGVKLATVSDYFLMTYQDGALVNNIAHYIKGPIGTKAFLDGETAALMGVRSEIEGTLHEQKASAQFIKPDMTGIFQEHWDVGVATHVESTGLKDAVGKVLAKLKDSGKLKDIFAKYGVTYIAPAQGD